MTALMLRELFVQNLALIEDVRVELRPGFCAWTGQTGAGKTLLLEALGLLLGERGSAELLRAGAEELRITGRFELTRPELRDEVRRLLDAPLADDELILTRRLTRAGRSYAYVNDQPVAVGTLRQLGAVLVDIHGQRESQSLLLPAYQLQVLDAYGHLDGQRRQYAALAEQVRDLRRRHATLTAERQQRQRELALVRFEREELDNAALKSGELAQLTQERERLAHAQSLMEFAAAGYARLHDDEGSVVEQLGKLQREAHGWVAHDPALAEVADRLEGLAAEVEDVAQTLRAMQERWEADPARLDEVEKRIQSLRRLEKKYDRPADDLPAYRATLDEREEQLQAQEDDLAGLSDELAATYSRLKEAAAELSAARQRVARRLVAAVQKELTELGMAEARLDAVLEPIPLGDDALTAEVPAWGAEALELTLAANKGEPARPLRKVASGGELARAMLALRLVLTEAPPTMVFDEVDAGVGGEAAQAVGRALAEVARRHQVLVVTHLAQVAACARQQLGVRKEVTGDRTVAQATVLEDDDRVVELARMLSGRPGSATARKHAEELLGPQGATGAPATRPSRPRPR